MRSRYIPPSLHAPSLVKAHNGFTRTAGIFSCPPALLSSLRCMRRVPAVSDTREMPLQLQVLLLRCPASLVPVLSRRHPGAPAAAFAAQPSYGQALCRLTLPKTFFYRRVRPHAHGLLWRCSRASAAAQHAWGRGLAGMMQQHQPVSSARMSSHFCRPPHQDGRRRMRVNRFVCTHNSTGLTRPPSRCQLCPHGKRRVSRLQQAHARYMAVKRLDNRKVVKQRIVESAPQADHTLPPSHRFLFTVINNRNVVDGADHRQRGLVADADSE